MTTSHLDPKVCTRNTVEEAIQDVWVQASVTKVSFNARHYESPTGRRLVLRVISVMFTLVSGFDFQKSESRVLS